MCCRRDIALGLGTLDCKGTSSYHSSLGLSDLDLDLDLDLAITLELLQCMAFVYFIFVLVMFEIIRLLCCTYIAVVLAIHISDRYVLLSLQASKVHIRVQMLLYVCISKCMYISTYISIEASQELCDGTDHGTRMSAPITKNGV